MAEQAVRISKDLDAKVYHVARDYYHKLKQGQEIESQPEIKVMVSGTMDDGQSSSMVVKIRPNPLNCRMTTGWKIVADGKVWEIPSWELEKSRLL